MAKRALIDSLSYLSMAFSLLSFLSFISRKTSRHFIMFGFSLLILQLVRESGVFVYPFFFVVLIYLKQRKHLDISLRDILLCFIIPLVSVAVVYQFVYGLPTVGRMVQAIYLDTVMTDSDYMAKYVSGPWYQYFVDFMILSPLTSLLACMYAGHFALKKPHDIRTGVLLFFYCYITAVHAFLPKDVRYVIILDLVIRIFASFAVLVFAAAFITQQVKKNIVTIMFILLLIAMDFMAFRKHFVTHNTYDPVSYNLLHAERFIPVAPHPARVQSTSPVSAADINAKTAETFFNDSFVLYREGKYPESIKAARKALEAKPDFADAYNNICAAYNELEQWDDAIRACEDALKLNPGSQLAKNNLAWANNGKMMSVKSGVKSQK